jgi:hypothetical protein
LAAIWADPWLLVLADPDDVSSSIDEKENGHPLYRLITTMTQTHFSTLPFFIAGILLLRGSPAGLYWLVPGFMFSLFAGILGAGALLVEILR